MREAEKHHQLRFSNRHDESMVKEISMGDGRFSLFSNPDRPKLSEFRISADLNGDKEQDMDDSSVWEGISELKDSRTGPIGSVRPLKPLPRRVTNRPTKPIPSRFQHLLLSQSTNGKDNSANAGVLSPLKHAQLPSDSESEEDHVRRPLKRLNHGSQHKLPPSSSSSSSGPSKSVHATKSRFDQDTLNLFNESNSESGLVPPSELFATGAEPLTPKGAQSKNLAQATSPFTLKCFGCKDSGYHNTMVEDLIQCDHCANWSHKRCETVPSDDDAQDKGWVCSYCTREWMSRRFVLLKPRLSKLCKVSLLASIVAFGKQSTEVSLDWYKGHRSGGKEFDKPYKKDMEGFTMTVKTFLTELERAKPLKPGRNFDWPLQLSSESLNRGYSNPHLMRAFNAAQTALFKILMRKQTHPVIDLYTRHCKRPPKNDVHVQRSVFPSSGRIAALKSLDLSDSDSNSPMLGELDVDVETDPEQVEKEPPRIPRNPSGTNPLNSLDTAFKPRFFCHSILPGDMEVIEDWYTNQFTVGTRERDPNDPSVTLAISKSDEQLRRDFNDQKRELQAPMIILLELITVRLYLKQSASNDELVYHLCRKYSDKQLKLAQTQGVPVDSRLYSAMTGTVLFQKTAPQIALNALRHIRGLKEKQVESLKVDCNDPSGQTLAESLADAKTVEGHSFGRWVEYKMDIQNLGCILGDIAELPSQRPKARQK